MRPVYLEVAARAAAQPEASAIVSAVGTLTYGGLNAGANRLARVLRELGVGPEVVVALLLPRAPEAVLAALAVGKAGGAYLPLDPAYPEERSAAALADASARVLVTTAPLLGAFPTLGAACPELLLLDRDRERIAAATPADPEPASGLENLAYVIYTSGSTGRPKGVEIEHRSLANLVVWHRRIYAPGPGDKTTRLAGSGFDAAVWEVWPALAAGASLHLPPDAALRAPRQLATWLAEHRITQTFLPTPLAEAVLAEPWPAGAALDLLLTGGDRLHRGPSPEHTFALANHYGPTEATVCATWTVVEPQAPQADGERTPPPIGLPVDGTVVRLADRELLPVPEGEPGELLIGGPSLARGYRGRPERTAECFVPDPWGGPGERLYRTGDRVRELPSGDLDFLGRLDFQVKIRGHRIELGEIETALRLEPQVREGVVLAREEGEESRLVAYVALEPGARPDSGALRAALARTLPESMVPAAWVFLPALPATPNGKVDRTALSRLAPVAMAEPVAPEGPFEEALAAIFGEILGVERVGSRDDFFALGGHSLKATQVLSRLRAALGVELAVADLYEHPTVASLARRAAAAGASEALDAIEPQPREGEIPLSYAQQELWFLERWVLGTAAYNTPMGVSLAGPLDVRALGRALSQVVRRHEGLRTAFPEVEGRPVQRILPAPEGLLPQIDLSGLGERAAEVAVRLSAEEGGRPFDLERGPVLRALLLRLDPSEHRLLLLLHHIASDDWTFSLILWELAELYHAFASSVPSLLPEPPLQYADFALWQHRLLAGPARAELLAYWRERLLGAPAVLALPTDRPRPPALSFAGARCCDNLAAPLVARLGALAREAGGSIFMVLAAAWSALLGRYAAQDDLFVGVPSALRNRVELEGVAGMLVNTLVLRAELCGNPSGEELIGRLRAATLGAYAHQDLPFPLLVEALQPARECSRHPLVQVLFVFGNAPRPPRELEPGITLTLSEVVLPNAKMDLSLYLTEEEDGGIALQWEYATDLFDGATVERLAGCFQILLAGLAAAPQARIAELPLLSAAERCQLAEWNAASGERPAGPERLDRLFAAQAARTPNATALLTGRERLTYADLAARVDRLARRLAARGVGPEVPVALFLPRTADLIVAMLATLQAGGFYVPLDPAYPAERLAFLAADSGARVLITVPDLAGKAPALAGEPLFVNVPESAAAALAEALPENLAYLIYTSGSTGKPKAVGIPHASAALLVRWAEGVFTAEERAAVLAATSIAFDLSVFEIFLPLATGGTVVLAENALGLADIPARGEVTLVNTVPSALAELLRQDALPPSVKTINLAGEALSRALADQVYARPGVRRLYNLYGPSEDTTYSTYALVERESRRAPAIGRPISGTSEHVLDRAGLPLPLGIPGELHLGGAGLARGYRGRPELTAERFVPDPFSAEPGARLYRTGDLVRLRREGALEFLGRLDHQVKVRGFRIELGEVEAALAACPGVTAAAVLALPGPDGETRLVAYIAPAAPATPEPAALKRTLRERLPQPMVPAVWVPLAALPLTPNGKIDRAALARLSPQEESAAPAGPLSATELLVAALFTEVLGCRGVAAGDDFFALGGHSLNATRVLSRLRKALGVDLAVRDLFDHPTVAALARRAEEVRDRGAQVERAILPEPRQGDLPLSYAQEELWFMERWAPGTPAYTLPTVIDLAGPLDPALLGRAWDELVRRHESLRTVYPEAQGRPVQRVVPPHPVPLPFCDVSALPWAQAAEAAYRLAAEEGRRPLDLAAGPLLRVALLRLSPVEHRLLVLLHHIVADDWTVSLLLSELAVLYSSLLEGRESPLPALPIQYADFTLWQRRHLTGAILAGHVDYWRGELRGAPQVLPLPTDRLRPAEPGFAGLRLPAHLSPELTSELGALARNAEASLFMVLLAGWSTLLGRYAGQDDLLVGSPSANRNRVELEGLAGLFVHTLVLRADFRGEPSGRALLAQLRERTLGAQAHQDLPFQRLVDALKPERDPSRPPLVQVFFVFGNAPRPPRELAPGVALGVREIDAAVAKVDLSLYIREEAGGLAVEWEYATALFDRATVERFHGHLTVLLAGLAAAPETPVAVLPLLAPAERDQLARWNAESAQAPAGPPTTLDRIFFTQAARTPDATALIVGAERLTYADLAARVDRLARVLAAHGVGPEVSVALFLPRTADLIAAMLATLSAGGFYVPLDPAYPAERLAFLLADSNAAVLLTCRELAGEAPAGLAERIFVDIEKDAAFPALPHPGTDPANLAYLIYTSGSTGRPKAVGISHASAVLLVRWATGVFPAPERRAVLAATSIAFDLSVFEIFLPLATGGAVVLAGNALALPELPARGEVTLVNTVPSALAELLRQGALPPSVQTVNLAGEALPRSLADEVYARPGVRRLYNLYGPSEDTTYSTFSLVERESPRAPALGVPIAGTSAHVLDRAGFQLPVGVPGELHLGGLSLARGYLGRPELTAERFVPDPFAATPGARLYRTGDLVRRRASGDLEFLGRLDHQVKVRGFRIELGEIEAALAACPEVAGAAVVARRDGSRELRLVAYVVSAASAEPSVAALRSALGMRLPASMIPTAWVFLPALPQTPNGKIDRRALPAPEPESAEPGAAYLAPRNPVEATLAEVWAAVLRLPQVGVHDNFFTLGGDSILTIQVVARCRARGLETTPQQLFRHQTVAALAEAVAIATPACESLPESAPSFSQADLSPGELEELLASLG